MVLMCRSPLEAGLLSHIKAFFKTTNSLAYQKLSVKYDNLAINIGRLARFRIVFVARQAERGRGLCPWLKTERWKRFMSASTADGCGAPDAHIRTAPAPPPLLIAIVGRSAVPYALGANGVSVVEGSGLQPLPWPRLAYRLTRPRQAFQKSSEKC